MMRQRFSRDPAAFARAYREAAIATVAALSDQAIATLVDMLEEARSAQRHVFICGNGGSAATSSHFAAGLGNEGSRQRTRRFRVLSLTDNVPWVTAVANDDAFAEIFVQQLQNFAEPGDVLVAFSSSGNSANVLRAVEWGSAHGLLTVGITGQQGGALAHAVGHAIIVSADHIGHIEEAHFLIQHLVTYYFAESTVGRQDSGRVASRLELPVTATASE